MAYPNFTFPTDVPIFHGRVNEYMEITIPVTCQAQANYQLYGYFSVNGGIVDEPNSTDGMPLGLLGNQTPALNIAGIGLNKVMSQDTSLKITGAPLKAGLHVISLKVLYHHYASGGSGAPWLLSDEVLRFVIAIEPECAEEVVIVPVDTGGVSLSDDLAIRLRINLEGPSVISEAPIEVADKELAMFMVKRGDKFPVQIRCFRGGEQTEITSLDSLRIILKEFEPDAEIELTPANGTFTKFGTGSNTVYQTSVDMDDDTFEALLSNYEEDGGTSFLALAEIELGTSTGNTRSTQTFNVKAERDLAK